VAGNSSSHAKRDAKLAISFVRADRVCYAALTFPLLNVTCWDGISVWDYRRPAADVAPRVASSAAELPCARARIPAEAPRPNLLHAAAGAARGTRRGTQPFSRAVPTALAACTWTPPRSCRARPI
jgi:hypothetical protein